MEFKTKTSKLETLQFMINRRTDMFIEQTEEIARLLAPTAFEAIYRYLQVPSESLTWTDIEQVEDILVLYGMVDTSMLDAESVVYEALASIDQDPDSTLKLVRVGFPIHIAVEPAEEVYKFLKENAIGKALTYNSETEEITYPEAPSSVDESMVPKVDANVAATDTHFSQEELTSDQKQQMLVFQHQSGRTVH